MTDVSLISFADKRLIAARRRFVRQAKTLESFDHIRVWSEDDLIKVTSPKCSVFWRETYRGFGFWSWKPFLILHELQQRRADIVVYADIGFHLITAGSINLSSYLDEVSFDKPLLLFSNSVSADSDLPKPEGQLSWPNHNYIKYETLKYFKLNRDTSFLSAEQITGGLLVIKNTEEIIRFYEKFCLIIEKNFELIDDSLEKISQLPEFKDHRHDQAVFNCLLKSEGVNFSVRSNNEMYYPRLDGKSDWSMIRDYPFHARRDLGIYRKLIGFFKYLKNK